MKGLGFQIKHLSQKEPVNENTLQESKHINALLFLGHFKNYFLTNALWNIFSLSFLSFLCLIQRFLIHD